MDNRDIYIIPSKIPNFEEGLLTYLNNTKAYVEARQKDPKALILPHYIYWPSCKPTTSDYGVSLKHLCDQLRDIFVQDTTRERPYTDAVILRHLKKAFPSIVVKNIELVDSFDIPTTWVRRRGYMQRKDGYTKVRSRKEKRLDLPPLDEAIKHIKSKVCKE